MTEQTHPDRNTQTYAAATEYATLANPLPTSDGEHIVPTDSAQETEQAAQELRAAQAGWLERRGVLEDTPHLTMPRREFEMLRNVGLGDGGDTTSRIIDETRRNYGIPPDAQYALIDIVPGDASLPHTTELVALQKEDFGTTVDEGRPESLGAQSESIPRITMTEREFRLFIAVGSNDGNASSSVIEHVRELYGIPNDGQPAPQYALVDVEPDDPSLPNEPLLMIINKLDFGTTIDPEVLDKDKASLDPGNPLSPESPAYHIVDIGETLTDAHYGLQAFASKLMEGRTENPLEKGRFWLRAGGLTARQEEAYVWESAPLKNAVALTLIPGQYDSICAVVGERQDAGNGKAGMAQIKNPKVILTIEGEALIRLQAVYRELYHEPDYALTPEQRSQRDEVFNDHLVRFTSEATTANKALEDEENRGHYGRSTPSYRYRKHP